MTHVHRTTALIYTKQAVILVSNLLSNAACANIVLPPLGCIAVHLGRHPLALMLPATLAGSFAFISPIATPANAIAYSMGALSVSELARVVRWIESVSMRVLLYACIAAHGVGWDVTFTFTQLRVPMLPQFLPSPPYRARSSRSSRWSCSCSSSPRSSVR